MSTHHASLDAPVAALAASTLRAKLAALAGDIKLHHTVFALPFALLSTFLAAKTTVGTLPEPGKVGLILLCMFTARTVAMAANRLLDATLDAKNPRTRRRAIPGGVLSRRFVLVATVLCAAGFVAACSLFYFVYANPWPLALSVPVLAFLCAYPLLKRFTRLCHYYLGAALALAPVCAWVAMKATLALPPVLMALAVLAWTAGFDIIYACQDYQSDVECGVFSVPAKIGVGPALWVSRLTHLFGVVMLVALGHLTPALGTLYYVGVGCAAVLLVVEHALVKSSDLSKVNLAFFTINGLVSVLLGTLGIADVLIH